MGSPVPNRVTREPSSSTARPHEETPHVNMIADREGNATRNSRIVARKHPTVWRLINSELRSCNRADFVCQDFAHPLAGVCIDAGANRTESVVGGRSRHRTRRVQCRSRVSRRDCSTPSLRISFSASQSSRLQSGTVVSPCNVATVQQRRPPSTRYCRSRPGAPGVPPPVLRMAVSAIRGGIFGRWIFGSGMARSPFVPKSYRDSTGTTLLRISGPHRRPPAGTLDSCSAKELQSGWVTGFEPAISRSTIWCLNR